VRLASQLSGWRLDIVSESRFQQIEEEAMAALSRLSTNEELSRSLYRMGFRSLDEVVEASEGELASVPGVSAEDVAKLREDAASAMEALRKERLAAMAEATEAPSERDKLLLVRGVNSRVADKLEQNSYSSVDAIAGEEDTDRLAIKSGLGAARAQALKAAVAEFVQTEWPPIEVKMLQSVAAAEAEAARLEAEAAAVAEAEAVALAAAEAQAAADAETATDAGSEAESEAGSDAGSEAETTQETR
jgi:N utilization substance protein A